MIRKKLKSKIRAKKKPEKCPKYHRLTKDYRTLIQNWLQEGKSRGKIASRLRVHTSTISREIKRNSGKKGYRASQADGKARARLLAKTSKPRKLTNLFWATALYYLARGWSFEMFCEHARLKDKNAPCRETLYLKYYKLQRYIKMPSLPRGHRKRHRRGKKGQAGRGCITNRLGIECRSKWVEHRVAIGHFEGDLINGLRGTGNLVTLAERTTRFTLVGYVEDKRADHVAAKIDEMMSWIPESLRKTITFDNGKEFADFAAIESALGVTVYFANPYHSWERGTNENRNGIVRKVLPKGSSFANIKEEQLAAIDYLLNDRPMKCLGWRTPREMFQAACAKVA